MLLSLIISILTGALAGWLAGFFINKSQGGFWWNVLWGIGFVGGWLLGQFGFHFDGWIGSLVTALIGAIIVIAIVNLIKKHR